MTSCTQCGLEVSDDALPCASCGTLAGGASPGPVTRIVHRPDGSGALAWCKGLGFAAAFFAPVALLRGGSISLSSMESDTLFNAAWQIAKALFWVALLVGLVGYVVRAISFLPGCDDKKD